MKIHLLRHWERYSSICEAEEEMDAETGAIAERLVSKGEIIDPREIRRPIIVKRSEQKKMGDLAHWRAIVLSQRAFSLQQSCQIVRQTSCLYELRKLS